MCPTWPIAARGCRSRGQLNETPAQYLSTQARARPGDHQLPERRLSPTRSRASIPSTALTSRARRAAAAVSAVRRRHVSRSRSATPGITRCRRGWRSGSRRATRLQLSYTWSKVMEAMEFLNATDRRLARKPIERVRPAAPAGRQRHLGNPGAAAAGAFGAKMPPRSSSWRAAGSWAASFRFSPGAPLGFGNVIFNGDIKDIALPRSERSVDRWFNTGRRLQPRSRASSSGRTSAPSRCVSAACAATCFRAGTSR